MRGRLVVLMFFVGGLVIGGTGGFLVPQSVPEEKERPVLWEYGRFEISDTGGIIIVGFDFPGEYWQEVGRDVKVWRALAAKIGMDGTEFPIFEGTNVDGEELEFMNSPRNANIVLNHLGKMGWELIDCEHVTEITNSTGRIHDEPDVIGDDIMELSSLNTDYYYNERMVFYCKRRID